MPVLDTSVLIELIHNTDLGQKAVEEIGNDAVAITPFAAHEILIGHDSRMLQLLGQFEVIDYCFEDAVESAEIEKELTSKGRLISRTDLFIAGICRRQNLELVTADKDFLNVKRLQVKFIGSTRK